MPHLTLEYSGNIKQQIRAHELFPKVHEVLVRLGPTKVEHCKSRAMRRDDYFIGDGGPRHAFVHLDVRLLSGRSLETKQGIGQQILKLLKGHFAPSLTELDLQITVEVRDIDRQVYFKIPEGTI